MRRRFDAANLFGGIDFEATVEDGQLGPQLSLARRAQPVAPVDTQLQCLLPRRRGAVATGQQRVLVVEALQYLRGRHRAHPSRSQFDGQRQSVDSGADPGHVGRIVLGQFETRHRRGRAVGEQRHRIVAGRPPP